MAWIESHQELADHPKTKRLMRLLGIDRYAAIGLVHVLWYWALDYADDGDLGACSDEDIADGVRWERDAGELVMALTTAGFLNADRTLHDWYEFAGRLIAQRESNAERQARWRERHRTPTKRTASASPDGDVTVTSPSRNAATVPNPDRTRTGPGPETGDDEGAAAHAAPPKPVPKKASGPDLAPLVDAFRALGLPDPVFAGGEGRAAQDLVRHYTPEVIAACWQDHASGDYGGALDKQKLSFRWLLTGSPVGNWQRWKAAPHAQNGHHKPGRGPGSRQENSTVDYAFQGILAAEPIGPADVTPEQWTALRTRLGALHEGDVRPEQWRAVQAALGRER